MNNGVLVLGETYPVARYTALALAAKGHSLFMAGRDTAELERIAVDCAVRYGVEVRTGFFDVEDFDSHESFVKSVISAMGDLKGVVLAFNYLGSHRKATKDFNHSLAIFSENFLGVCSVLTPLANSFDDKKGGFIIVITSIEGDKGRGRNYVYSAAHAALTRYMEGLRNRLFSRSFVVLTVKCGLLDTLETFGKVSPRYLADPMKVGKKIVKALYRRQDVVYIPSYWRPIMSMIRHLPESLYKRIKF